VQRQLFEEEHDSFRRSVRHWLEKEVVPHTEKWESDGIVPREIFQMAGAQGFLGIAIPEEYGGGGVDDFRYNVILGEEVQATGAGSCGIGLTLHTDVCLPYFIRYCDDDQRQRWLPGLASGDLISAISMTEPGTGSDLAAITTSADLADGEYVVNGAKTFVTNGVNADLVIVAVKTDRTARHRGISLLVVERGMEGFSRGRRLEKLGLHGQDTSELFFSFVRVPSENLLGGEGQGFLYLVKNLPQERLGIAVSAIASARAALEWTLSYTKERTAFGQSIGSFQNSRFVLAELMTEITIGQVFVDRCVLALNSGELSAEEAAMAKWWCTELQQRVMTRCLQLHGGYGYMMEFPIARAFVDARITTIYGGTTEIMKEVIGRSLGI
jgi:alkylation response protein AidB-like acyl-CoA dehydrogenase